MNIEGAKVRIKEVAVLKKFDGDWTDEQIEAGEADAHLAERITLEDGVIVDHWSKESGSPTPSVKEGAGGPEHS